MLTLSTFMPLSRERPAFEDLARQCAYTGIQTICGATTTDWDEAAVTELRRFLDDYGLSFGEFSRFPLGLGSPDPAASQEALETYRRHFAHAQILGAQCVGFSFAGMYSQPDVRSAVAWDRVVAATAALSEMAEAAGVDCAAHPHLMGPLYSVECVARLLADVRSSRLKVLADPINIVRPDDYYDTAALLDGMFDRLGDQIVAIHAKDVVMTGAVFDGRCRFMLYRLDEAIPGKGVLDYRTFLRRADALGRKIIINAEHLDSVDEVIVAFHYIRSIAAAEGIELT